MPINLTPLLGGLGLFLLGMHMLSQGLRLAAGSALEGGLAKATGTRWRGLASGVATTAVVQSSSAVTVATIGFVNAGLLSLGSAIWVLFGANLGTTATGWIVALAGFKLDIAAFSLPLIAAGAAMKVFGQRRQMSAWGDAVAGFGLLFYGITLMQTGFISVAQHWQVPQSQDLDGLILQTLFGVFMTVIMQSSSASTAVALSAAQAGLLDLTGAAAVVIGANIGTTFTAVLACVGATSNAKRVAVAHVMFNVITAMVAFIVLPWLMPGIRSLCLWLDAGDSPALSLAIFNTTFNVLGVLIMWPMAAGLTAFLLRCFKPDEGLGIKPVFLDQTTLPVPGMAARALASELERMVSMARACLKETVPPIEQLLPSLTEGTISDLAGRERVRARHQDEYVTREGTSQSKSCARGGTARGDLKQLIRISESFVDQMNRQAMDESTGELLAQLLRVRRYLENVVDGVGEIESVPDDMAECDALHAVYGQYVREFVGLVDPQAGHELTLSVYESSYQALKQAVLKLGASGNWRIEQMERALRRLSAQRRATQQLWKASQWLNKAQNDRNSTPIPTEESAVI